MSLAKPKNHKSNFLIIISGLILLVVSLGNVFIYNKIVNRQHLLKNREEENQALRLVNVDRKNQLYKLLDTNQLVQFSKDEGLVKVQKPEYLEVNPANDNPVSFYNTNN